MALAALLAALYAVAVTLLAGISFEPFQIRVADVLLPLSILFGLPAVVGLTLGNLVGNLSSPFGAVDIIGGTGANFVATLLAWRIGRIRFRGAWLTAAALETVTVALIVGSYLSVLIPLPLWISLLGVFIGSFIAINVAGYLLVRGVSRVLKIG